LSFRRNKRIVGYTATSSNTENVYRAEMFPGLGYMMKRLVFEQNLRGKMNDCCSLRSVIRLFNQSHLLQAVLAWVS